MPLTIATATIKENVDFYFDTFALDRWFDPDKVVFDDGSFRQAGTGHLPACRQKTRGRSRRMSRHRGCLFRSACGQQREHRHDHRDRPVLQKPGNLPEGKPLQGRRHHRLQRLHPTTLREASLKNKRERTIGSTDCAFSFLRCCGVAQGYRITGSCAPVNDGFSGGAYCFWCFPPGRDSSPEVPAVFYRLLRWASARRRWNRFRYSPPVSGPFTGAGSGFRIPQRSRKTHP